MEEISIEELRENSFEIDVGYTLGELEWQKMVGPSGLGRHLLEKMSNLGESRFRIGPVEHRSTSDADLLEFAFEDEQVRIRLDYDVPYTKNLLSGIRTLLNTVNRSLRRAHTPWRYVVIREESSSGKYRVALLPTDQLGVVSKHMRVVAGVSPEDFEAVAN
ncbi:MAG: hypothetical protein ACQEVA_11300 [Myxococcota bacterium]